MALTLNKQNFTFTGKSLNITAEKNKLLEPYDLPKYDLDGNAYAKGF